MWTACLVSGRQILFCEVFILIKRFIPLMVVVAVLCSMLAIPAFAADVSREVLDYRDFAKKADSADGSDYLSIRLPKQYCSVYCKTLDGVSYVRNNVSGTVDFSYQADCYASVKFCFPGCVYSDPRYYMSLDNIEDGTPFHLYSKFFVDPNFSGTYSVRFYYQVNYYDASYGNIAVLPTKPLTFIFDTCSGRFDGVYETSDDPANVFDAPEGSKYFAVSLVVRVEDVVVDNPDNQSIDKLSIDFGFSDYSLDLMKDELLPAESADFIGSIGTFFTSSMGWIGDIFSLVVSNAPLLVLTVGIFACGFVLLLVSRLKS